MSGRGSRQVGGRVLGLALLALAVADGATAETTDKPIALSAQRGFALDSVRAIIDGEGVRFHGAVCRRTFGTAPRFVRADRLDRVGHVLSTASKVLWDLRGPDRRCTFFDLPTAAPAMPGEQFRVCLLTTNRPCPEPASAAPSASDKATKGRP